MGFPPGDGDARPGDARPGAAGPRAGTGDTGPGAPGPRPGTGDTGPGAAGPPLSTGDARVDEAVARLDDLPGLPVAEHPAVFTYVHERLAEALGDLDARDPAGPGARSPGPGG